MSAKQAFQSISPLPLKTREIGLFGTGGGDRTAKAADIGFLESIPFDPKMVECSDNGVSYQDHYTDSPTAKAFIKIVDNILKRCG